MCLNELNVIQDIPEYLKLGIKWEKKRVIRKINRFKKIKANKRQVLLDRVSILRRMFNPLRCGELLILY